MELKRTYMNDEDVLRQSDLKKAEENIKRRKFKNNLPVVVQERGQLFHLYKNGKKEKIKV